MIYNTQPRLRTIYESCMNQGSPESGVQRWRDFFRHTLLGIHVDENGRKSIRNRQMKPEEFCRGGNLAETAVSILGPNAHEILSTPRTELYARGLRELYEASAKPRQLYEAGNTAIQPSQFIDISSWDVTVGGLIESKIIEEYRKPGYIMDRLFRKIPTTMHAEKLIATGRIGDKALLMQPGQSHPAAQFTERFITTPYTMKYGLKCEVTKEAVFFDRTNQVLTRAGSIGLELGLRRELWMTDVFLGVINPYIYGGVAYNTYITSGGNWANDITGNSLTDVNNLNTMWVSAQRMTDQESGQRIAVQPKTIVVPPGARFTAGNIIRSTQNEFLTSGSGSVYNQGTRTHAPQAEDFYGDSIGQYEILWSPFIDQRMLAADGLNLSASTAAGYWWAVVEDMAFAWMENWDINIMTVNANDYVMADNGIVMAAIGDFMGTPAVYDPRYVIRSRG